MSEFFVSKVVREARLDTCNHCPFYNKQFDGVMSVLNTCRVCNCLMEGKTWLEGVVCPKGLWVDRGAKNESVSTKKGKPEDVQAAQEGR
jgi:hypothetical protein